VPRRWIAGLVASAALAVWAADVQEWTVPAEEKARTMPIPYNAEARNRGRDLYNKHCALCHGDSGRGDGPVAKLHAKRTSRPPHDLTDAAIQANMTDGEIFWKVSTGYRLGTQVIMPAFVREIASADDRWRVVQYVRSLAPTR
jgi:mono/diheme cytochrome c family protein